MPQASSAYDAFIAIWPTIFMMDLLRYVLAASTLALILFIFLAPLESRRIQSRKASGNDIRREIVYSLSTTLLFSLVGYLVYLGTTNGLFQLYGGDLPPAYRLIAEFTVLVVLHDAYFYWAHRAMHTRWLFRKVHRLHHRSKTPTPWAAYAFAPPEALLEAGIMPVSALLLPVHELSLFLFLAHMIARNVIGHAGIELFPGWWLRAPFLRRITTTTHHDLHHSHGAYNFGLYFTWWDRWMRTEHPAYSRRFAEVTRSACPLKFAVKENQSD